LDFFDRFALSSVNSLELHQTRKATVMMQQIRRFSPILASALFFLAIYASSSPAQTPIKTIDMPQGGRIVYGTVPGAETQGAAMTQLLRGIHKSCGDKPQIGNVFKLRGTDSVGVFFTATDHSSSDKQLAGLIIAAGSGTNKTEAALLSDFANNFGSSINPMLTKLFTVWHPAGGMTSAPASKSASDAPPTQAAGHPGKVPSLHTVSAPDNSASISIPDGWHVDPRSGRGAIIVMGPRGESVGINMSRNAVDPSSQWQRNFWSHGGSPPPGSVVYPYHGNLIKAFPDMFQAWRRAGGLGPARLQIDKIEPLPEKTEMECVVATGQVDPDGKGMQAMNDMMCAIPPLDFGGYTITLSHALLPLALATEEHETQQAIISSFRPNQQVIGQQMAQQAQQKIASDQAIRQIAQQQIDQIQQIGAQATARYNATQAANDAQHATYWAQQDSNARNGAGLSNYLLDQTVIRDVQDPNTHVTVWNRTAEAWQKAYPDRVEEVPTAQYIKGQDF
jgi:hypothetical protein